MNQVFGHLREHRHFIIIVTLLTVIVTFPTIVQVFRTDEFWLPTGESGDALTEIWDVWYGRLFLSGQADRFYADRIFYPNGVSLVYHPFNLPYVIVVSALQAIMPVSNAFSLAYLIIIYISTLGAYVYLRWLMKDKWIALFGAIVFGFSPHVVGHPNHPNNALVATIPLLVYCFHRGILENRRHLVVAAGLLTGLSSVINIYAYVCAVLSLCLMSFAFAVSRWRSKQFWLLCAFLGAAIFISSIWRIYPMIANSQALDAALVWRGVLDNRNDVVSYFVNHRNPIIGPAAHELLDTVVTVKFSQTGYLGFLPLILIGLGLAARSTRSKMLPWLALCAVFLVLRLGTALSINGVRYSDVLLPQHFLSEILPSVFRPFFEADNYQIGALLPLAILACYGVVALRRWRPIAARSGFIILLILLVATEYYIPVRPWIFPKAQFAFLDWLTAEGDSQDIRVINLPIGRSNSKLYNLYQALSSISHAEGAVSRTPDRAFDYIRENLLLSFWRQQRPIHCNFVDKAMYLSAVEALKRDGFSHIVFHQRAFNSFADVKESFRGIDPTYSDDFASIYALDDLPSTCSDEPDSRLRYTAALSDALQHAPWQARHGESIIMPPSAAARDYFEWYLRYFTRIEAPLVIFSSDELANLNIQRPGAADMISFADLEKQHALWLVNASQEFKAEDTAAYQEWFAKRFRFCRRFYEGERGSIDIYVKHDISCAAVDQSSAIEALYDSTLRLHNIAYDVDSDVIRFYLAWTNNTRDDFGFSLQFFDEDGNKALQYDNVVLRQLLTIHEVDATALEKGEFSVQLIVYDYENRVSGGGLITSTGERFTREIEIAKIDL